MHALLNLQGRRAVKALLLAAAVAGSARAQTGLGLAPMRIELDLAPGAVSTGTLTLVNHGEGAARVAGDTLDFYLDATGTPQFGRDYAEEADFSCRTWLAANPMELELNGGAQAPVRYSVRVPQTATPRAYHCALGFTTQPTAEDQRAIGLRTAVQIVAAIYVVVGKPVLDGSIKDLRLEAAPNGDGWRAIVILNNAGLLHFRPEGELAVLDESGTVIETVRFVPMPVLPKRDQQFVFPLKLNPGEGKYRLRARVDLGGAEVQEATASVVATKPK
jgi:hypothetical protein